MSKRPRFSPQVKSSILQQLPQNKETISSLCEEHGCSPRSIYQWQDILFSRANTLFENGNPRGRPIDLKADKQKAEELQKTLNKKRNYRPIDGGVVDKKKQDGGNLRSCWVAPQA